MNEIHSTLLTLPTHTSKLGKGSNNNITAPRRDKTPPNTLIAVICNAPKNSIFTTKNKLNGIKSSAKLWIIVFSHALSMIHESNPIFSSMSSFSHGFAVLPFQVYPCEAPAVSFLRSLFLQSPKESAHQTI